MNTDKFNFIFAIDIEKMEFVNVTKDMETSSGVLPGDTIPTFRQIITTDPILLCISEYLSNRDILILSSVSAWLRRYLRIKPDINVSAKLYELSEEYRLRKRHPAKNIIVSIILGRNRKEICKYSGRSDWFLLSLILPCIWRD